MRPGGPPLKFYALCFLQDEARRATREGRAAPSFPIRLALGYLSTKSRIPAEDTRQMINGFWRELTHLGATNVETAAGFGRWQMLNSYLNGLANAVGLPRDHDFDEAKAIAERDPTALSRLRARQRASKEHVQPQAPES